MIKQLVVYWIISISINLSRQNKFDADLKAIKPINFTGNLDRSRNNHNNFFITEVAKEPF